VRRTRFEVAVATADAYLTLVVAQETERAAQAGVDRPGLCCGQPTPWSIRNSGREPTLREPMPNWQLRAHN